MERGKKNMPLSKFNSSPHKRQWKESGPEQRELEKLLRNKIIDVSDNPNDIRSQYPVFREFSERVFTSHFRKTSAKFGFYAQQPSTSSGVPELGLSRKRASSAEPLDTDEESADELERKTVANNYYDNSPILTWSYTDHDKNCDFVFVAVPIISGSREITFMIAENGMSVIINYLWPSAFIKAKELFSDEINNHRLNISAQHPKIHALTSALVRAGITGNSSPKGRIIVKLPMRVQREVGSWKKKAIKKEDGTKIVLLELTGFQEKLIIKNADTRINFD